MSQPHDEQILECVKQLKLLARVLEATVTHPWGEPSPLTYTKSVAGPAVVRLAGDNDKARTLWKLVAKDCGGYMPHSAAMALVRAANVGSLVPDVEGPQL